MLGQPVNCLPPGQAQGGPGLPENGPSWQREALSAPSSLDPLAPDIVLHPPFHFPSFHFFKLVIKLSDFQLSLTSIDHYITVIHMTSYSPLYPHAIPNYHTINCLSYTHCLFLVSRLFLFSCSFLFQTQMLCTAPYTYLLSIFLVCCNSLLGSVTLC